jgi:peptidoglycan hydrolase CwlO-like protein
VYLRSRKASHNSISINRLNPPIFQKRKRRAAAAAAAEKPAAKNTAEEPARQRQCSTAPKKTPRENAKNAAENYDRRAGDN